MESGPTDPMVWPPLAYARESVGRFTFFSRSTGGYRERPFLLMALFGNVCSRDSASDFVFALSSFPITPYNELFYICRRHNQNSSSAFLAQIQTKESQQGNPLQDSGRMRIRWFLSCYLVVSHKKLRTYMHKASMHALDIATELELRKCKRNCFALVRQTD